MATVPRLPGLWLSWSELAPGADTPPPSGLATATAHNFRLRALAPGQTPWSFQAVRGDILELWGSGVSNGWVPLGLAAGARLTVGLWARGATLHPPRLLGVPPFSQACVPKSRDGRWLVPGLSSSAGLAERWEPSLAPAPAPTSLGHPSSAECPSVLWV